MIEYIVRVWVDLKIQANNEAEAKQLAKVFPMKFTETQTTEVYDIQLSGQVWMRNTED